MMSTEPPVTRIYRLILIVSTVYQSSVPVGQALQNNLLLPGAGALMAGWTLGRLLPASWGLFPCQPGMGNALLRTLLILSWVPIHHLHVPALLQLLYAAGMISLLLRRQGGGLKRRVQDRVAALRSRFAQPGRRAHS